MRKMILIGCEEILLGMLAQFFSILLGCHRILFWLGSQFHSLFWLDATRCGPGPDWVLSLPSSLQDEWSVWRMVLQGQCVIEKLLYQARRPGAQQVLVMANHVWDHVKPRLVLRSYWSWKQGSRQIPWGTCLDIYKTWLVRNTSPQYQ
jgi:hypothetical protein